MARHFSICSLLFQRFSLASHFVLTEVYSDCEHIYGLEKCSIFAFKSHNVEESLSRANCRRMERTKNGHKPEQLEML